MPDAQDQARPDQLALVNAALPVPPKRPVSVNVQSDGSIGRDAGFASPGRRGSRSAGTGRPTS